MVWLRGHNFYNPRSLEEALLVTELHQKLVLLTKKYQKEILFGRIFWGAHTGQTRYRAKHVWVRRSYILKIEGEKR